MKLAAFVICALALHCAAQAQTTLWNELSQGDLSDNRFAPSAFTLTSGENNLYGILSGARPTGGFDRDYFSITVPAGLQLSELVLDLYDSTDITSFLGIQPGSIFPNDPATVNPFDLMGWLHMGPTYIGQDLLPIMSDNGYGFTAPLPSGTYTFWAQQMDDYTVWNGKFIVTEVPAPPAAAALLMFGLASRRRRA